MRVGGQSLEVGERHAGLPQHLEVAPVEAGHARPLQEVVHAQGGAEAGGAGGGQGVIGARDIVAQRDRGIGTDEDRARVLHLGGERRRIGGDQLEVLGREVVGHLHRLVQVGHDHDAAVGGLDHLGPVEALQQ